MKIPTYRSTPGLNHFPRNQQLSIWREAHRKLMSVDPGYRNHRYLFRLAIAFFVLAPAWVIHAGNVKEDQGVLILTLIGAVPVVVLFFCDQHFMSRAIGRNLIEKDRQ